MKNNLEPKNDCEQGYAPGSVCKFCPTKGCKARRYCSKEVPEFERAIQVEPEKNCDNCAHNTKYPNPNCEGTNCKNTGYSLWQPKAAEPQDWKERFREHFAWLMDCYGPKAVKELEDAIRDELEREVAAVVSYMLANKGLLVSTLAGNIKRGKHRGIK